MQKLKKKYFLILMLLKSFLRIYHPKLALDKYVELVKDLTQHGIFTKITFSTRKATYCQYSKELFCQDLGYLHISCNVLFLTWLNSTIKSFFGNMGFPELSFFGSALFQEINKQMHTLRSEISVGPTFTCFGTFS